MWFHQGYAYIAGFDKPWIVSINAIVSRVEDEGFKVLFASQCEDYVAPFHLPRECGDRYDWIAAVLRTGPTAWFDVPDRVAWMAVAPQEAPLPPPPPPQLVDGIPVTTPPQPPADLALVHTSDGSNDGRRRLHVAAEAAALAVVAPVMWASAAEVKTPALRAGLRAGAVATLVADGYLLWSYLSR